MPWEETHLMDLRSQFVCAFESNLIDMTSLCREYGISRPTGYFWVRRHRDAVSTGMANLSRAPHSCPHRTPADVVAAIVKCRNDHPRWGPRKVLVVLTRDRPELLDRLPASSTAGDILKAAGLVPTRKCRSRSEHPGSSPVVTDIPNDVWYIDFKGEFRMRDGVLCYPLTVTDAKTRYLLGCVGSPSTHHEGVQIALQLLFEQVGLPKAIRSDNGNPFCTIAIGGISRLSIWWTKLGILHDRSRPARPQDNGQHERMHRDLKAGTARPPAQNMVSQQESFDAFRHEFNHVRPHEALDMKTPASVWRPSAREMPATLPEYEYPGHMTVRLVSESGEYKFSGQPIFLSQVLSNERIALEETDDGIWSLYFCDRLLGKMDERVMKVVPIAPKPVLDRSVLQ